MEDLEVVLVGAGGPLGETLLELLEQRRFPVRRLHPVSGAAALTDKVEFRGESLAVQPLKTFDFAGADLAFFACGPGEAADFAPKAAAVGCSVVDLSGRFSDDPNVPLVVPEVNPEALEGLGRGALIASPVPVVVALATVLNPLRKEAALKRCHVATYQAVSDAGRQGIEELAMQTANLLNGRQPSSRAFSKQIAFNCLPQVGAIGDDGASAAETAVLSQTRRLLDDASLPVTVTAVQVPVFYGHAAAVHLELSEKIPADRARRILETAPGVRVVDDPAAGAWPTPVSEAANHDEVFVGRIREDAVDPKGLNFWVVADNVRKGAVLNAVQIGERLFSTPG